MLFILASEIAFTDFKLNEIKQCIVFFGTPGILYNINKAYIYWNFLKRMNQAKLNRSRWEVWLFKNELRLTCYGCLFLSEVIL